LYFVGNLLFVFHVQSTTENFVTEEKAKEIDVRNIVKLLLFILYLKIRHNILFLWSVFLI